MSAPSAIGDLRLRVAIEAPIDIPDGAGGMTRSYARLANVWAHVSALSGEDRFLAARHEQSILHLVRIRWRGDVTNDMRFVASDRKLFIRSCFDPDGRRRFLLCRCEEIS